MITFDELVMQIKHDYEEFSGDIIVSENTIDIINPQPTRFNTKFDKKITSVLINDSELFDFFKLQKDTLEYDVELVNFKISNIGDNFHDVVYNGCVLMANMDFGYRFIYKHKYRLIKIIRRGDK